MGTQTVTTDAKLSACVGTIRALLRKQGWVRVSWSADKGRSVSQNALAHSWYGQIASELGDRTEREVRAECKLLYGVKILREEVPEYREQYDRLIKGRFTYEEKLALMAGAGDDDGYPVTRLMSTDQLTRYLEAIHEAYRGRVALEFPMERAA